MKKLVLGSLVLATVSQAAGCIITSDDPEYAIVSAQWALKSNAGQTLTCPPGTTTAAVYAQEVNTDYKPVGSPFIELYDCNAGVGNSDPLPPSVYEMWVELTSEGGGQVYATSTSRNEAAPTERFPDGYFVDVVDVDKTFKTTIFADAGYFQFDWDLRNAANQPITCGSVAKVAALSTSVTNPNNSFDDPDANEIQTNTIHGPLVCTGNSPAAQQGDSEGLVNTVTGPKVGECNAPGI